MFRTTNKRYLSQENVDVAKRRIESLLIAAQNNAIRTNHIKARIDKKQQNRRCRLCDDRDETINHISECRKLAQKEYKTRHDWVGKVIHRELCKKLKFDHTNKWYMPNPESIVENETPKFLWDFDIQTEHLISARRPDLIIINKKKRTCRIVDFGVPADHWVKLKENENRDWPCKGIEKKTVEHQCEIYTNCNWRSCYSHQRTDTGTGGLGNKRTSKNHPSYNIIKIG